MSVDPKYAQNKSIQTNEINILCKIQFIFRVFEKFCQISELACMLSSFIWKLLISFVRNYERYILRHTECSVVGRLVRIFSAVRCGEISGPSKGLSDEYFGSWQRRLTFSLCVFFTLRMPWWSTAFRHCSCMHAIVCQHRWAAFAFVKRANTLPKYLN